MKWGGGCSEREKYLIKVPLLIGVRGGDRTYDSDLI